MIERYIRIVLLLVAVVAVCYVVSAAWGMWTSKSAQTVEAYADAMIDACRDADYKPFCYEEEVPALLGVLETDEIFSVIRMIRAKDSEYAFCHVLAHSIGEHEVERDRDNWIDVLAHGPTDGLCSNGYAHGAIVARFASEYLTEDEMNSAIGELSIACEARDDYAPTDLHRAMCYHGLGHVLVHITEADIGRALTACEQVALKDTGEDFRRVCNEGVYMQLFQPLEPEDEALIAKLPTAPERENITTWCSENSSNTAEFATCWREAWPFFDTEMDSASGIASYCDVLPVGDDRESCYVTAYTIVGRHNLERPEKIIETCSATASERQTTCFSRTANVFVEEDPEAVEASVSICAAASGEVAGKCYQFLADTATFTFHAGSPGHARMCDVLPVAYQNRCRQE